MCDSGLPKPDVVFFMDTKLNGSTHQTRENFGAERYENAEFQSRVYDNFLKLYELDHWIKLDANDTIENIQSVVFGCVVEILLKQCCNNNNKSNSEEIKTLW